MDASYDWRLLRPTAEDPLFVVQRHDQWLALVVVVYFLSATPRGVDGMYLVMDGSMCEVEESNNVAD